MSLRNFKMNGDDDESLTFVVEDIQKIILDTVELCLGGSIFSYSKVPSWAAVITEKILQKLNKLNKPFKYIVRIHFTHKNGAGLHTAAAYFWDNATDNVCTVRWENKFMYCIVNIFGMALQ